MTPPRRSARYLTAIAGLWLAAAPAPAAAISCADAAAAAEAATGLPSGLLLAIGKVESGRTDAAGLRAPWPWTINAGGIGRFFDTAADAVFAVEALRGAGLQSIDIGCFQINLVHHPDAFTSIASGFDPLTNAGAAARFLLSLRAELGAWEPAIAAYHSRLDMLGAPYRDRVLAVWHGAAPFAPLPGVPLPGVPRLPGAPAWAGSISLTSAAVSMVPVWGPAGEIGRGGKAGLASGRSLTLGRTTSRLPHVITVSAR